MNKLPQTVEGLIKHLEDSECNLAITPDMSKDMIMWRAGRKSLVECLRYQFDKQAQFEQRNDVTLKGGD